MPIADKHSYTPLRKGRWASNSPRHLAGMRLFSTVLPNVISSTEESRCVIYSTNTDLIVPLL